MKILLKYGITFKNIKFDAFVATFSQKLGSEMVIWGKCRQEIKFIVI